MKKLIRDYFNRKKEELKAYGKKNLIIRCITIFSTIIIASLIIILLANNNYYKNKYNIDYTEIVFNKLEKAKVLEIISEDDNPASPAYDYHITYKALMLSGEDEGKEVIVNQYMNDYTANYTKTVKKGSIIYVGKQASSGDTISYLFNGDSISFDHKAGIIILSIVLILLLLIVSKTKGLLTIISLALTILVVLFVFLPRIIIGNNIYLLTIFTCVFIVVVTYLIVVGANKKGLCASLACIAGLLLSGLLSIIAMSLLHVTGHYANEDVSEITLLFQSLYNVDIVIDLKAIIFASTLIGALGAVMDVSLSLSSSLKEVYDNAKETSVLNTIKSGFVIGKDMIGTMVNTLILAYLASDTGFILYMMVHHSNSFILRSEYIAVAIAQALVGSIAMVLTIPLTSIICAFVYNKNNKKGEEIDEEN